jgi:hypothetical protein
MVAGSTGHWGNVSEKRYEGLMPKLSPLFTPAAIFLMLLSSANAADVPLWKSDPFKVAPANTPDFIVYCGTHEDVCRVAVVVVNNGNSISQMNGTQACTLPDPPDISTTKVKRAEQTLEILAWMKTNNAVLSSNPQDAIKQAFAALWPEGCKDSFFQKPN